MELLQQVQTEMQISPQGAISTSTMVKLSKAAHETPDDPRLRATLGHALLKTAGTPEAHDTLLRSTQDKALGHLRAALELAPQMAGVPQQIASTLQQRGDEASREEAIKLFRKAVKVRVRGRRVHHKLQRRRTYCDVAAGVACAFL